MSLCVPVPPRPHPFDPTPSQSHWAPSPFVSQPHWDPTPLYHSPIEPPVPLCPSPTETPPLCITVPLSPQSLCVPAPLRPHPFVSQSHWAPSPFVSQPHWVLNPLGTSTIYQSFALLLCCSLWARHGGHSLGFLLQILLSVISDWLVLLRWLAALNTPLWPLYLLLLCRWIKDLSFLCVLCR